MSNSKFKGTGVALITPFTSNGSVDYDSFNKLLHHTTEQGGVDYWVVQGTTGESPTITSDEKKKILSYTIDHNPKQLPIVYGIGSNSTAKVIDMIKDTDLEHVDAILSASPYYNKPSQAGIIKHYEEIADNSPVPIILYNVPGRTSSNLTSTTTIELSKHNNIIGIKEASGHMGQCMSILRGKSSDFFLTSGDDLLTVPLMSMGAIGVISVLANGFPTYWQRIVNSARDTNYREASNITFKFLEINPLLYEEGNPVGIKEVLAQLGVCDNYTRLPILPASDHLKVKIKDAIKKINE